MPSGNVGKMRRNGRLDARARPCDDAKKTASWLLAWQNRSVLFPGCPAHELAAITEHTAARGSGRVGRTEALKGLVFVSEVFHNEEIGLEQMGGKMHRVFFSNTKLGEFNCAEMRFPSRGWAR
jgi:hypothetical protein